MQTRVLLVEDDPAAGPALRKVLVAESYDVQWVLRAEDALVEVTEHDFSAVITDLKLPGLSGLELVRQLHASRPRLPIILMTAHGTTETAIEATQLGASEYLIKPFEADELLDALASAVRNSRLMSEPVAIGEAPREGSALIGSSRVMQEVYKTIGRVAGTPIAVSIRGATGTGKELIARAIYQYSNRAAQPFIAVNCAAIPKDLLESELFGHERGAFTGAHARRIGRFEQANGGTIFLDEIGDLHPDTQAKLLRVLQERSFQRVGGDQLLQVDVRVITATHRDLEAAMRQGQFREDLFYRVSVVTIHLPPLAERLEDIPQLARFFVQRFGPQLGVPNPSIEPDALALLQHESWPGNVRQLENAIRGALVLARPFAITREHLQKVLPKSTTPPAWLQAQAGYISDLLNRARRGEESGLYSRMIADFEPELFSQAIRLANGNQAKAARWLGVTRLKMREKLIELGLLPGSL
jgi:nitrogen regulation protein NR(I)